MSSRNDSGFALPVVLWACVLIAVIVSGLLTFERSLRREAHDATLASSLQCLDEAAISTVLDDLTRSSKRLVRRLDGPPQVISVMGEDVAVSVQDQAGLIDLNTAGHDTLRRLFAAAGTDLAEADAYADRIEDWREKSIGKRLNGAKRDDYASAGSAYGPREATFRSVGELRLILGMTDTLFGRVSSALTVYSENPSVDATVAPRLVLRAVTTMSDADIDDVMLERQTKASSTDAATPTMLIGHAARILATASRSGLVIRHSATVRLTGQLNRPYWFYLWQ